MQVLSDTLRLVWERWTDPGDYPNGLAGGPLRPRSFVAEVKGRVVVKFDPQDLELMEAPSLTREVAKDYLADYPERAFEHYAIKVTKWDLMQVSGNQAVLEPLKWEDR